MSKPDSQPSAVGPLSVRIGRGALVGLGAALLVGGLDALGSAEGVARQFDSLEQRLWFGLLTLLAPIPVLMLAAAAQSALSQLIVALIALSRRLPSGEQPRVQQRWLGRSWALLATPGIVWVCSQIFAGPRAQQIPGRRLLAAVLAVVGVFAVSGSVQAGLRLLDWVKAGPRLGPRVFRAACLTLPAAALLGLLYVADCRVLPRLYPFFHLSLQAALLLCAELCAAALLAISSRRFRGELLVFLALALFAGGWAGHRLQRAQTLRSLALEHTRLVAQVLRLEGALHDGPRRPPLPPPQAELLTDAELATPPQFVGPRLAGRDMFLITVDALRFDAVNPATMPFVSSLLPQAVVFHRAYTQVPHTSFAIATLLTGKPVYALLTLGQDAGSHETLPLILRRFRYKTAAFYPPSVFYVEHERLRRLEESAYGFEYVKFEYLAAPQRTAQLMHFLEEEKPQRVFAWVHYLEPHEPYDPHPGGPDASRPDRERYDGEVHFIDDELRRLVAYLQRTRPSAVLILAADHGEEFGEHGGRYHGTSLYEEQAHVPLMIVDLAKLAASGAAPPDANPPPGGLSAQAVAQPVGLIDVAPTVLGLLDIEPSVRMRGHDLAPWLLARAKSLPLWPVFSEIGRKKMIVRGDKKLICDFATDSCQAFDLQRDPEERRSTLDSDPQSAATLRMLLDRFIAEARRFEERPTADAPEPSAAEQAAALSRGHMGDRTALSALVALLAGAETPPAQRREALAVVAQLAAAALPDLGAHPSGAARDALLTEPPLADAALRARLRALFTQARSAAPPEPSWLRWTAILHLRLNAAGTEPDDLAAQAVVAALIADEQAPAEQRFTAALALFALPRCQAATSTAAALLPGPPSEPTQPHPAAAPSAPPSGAPKPAAATTSPDCVGLWLTALPAAMSLDDPDRVRPLLLALGRSRDPRALSAILALIEPSVRSRSDLVTALGLLGNANAVAPLAELLASDPYVPVRTAAATALGRLGGAAAQSALQRAAASERESLVRTAIAAALTGAP